jgi:hypothetical protein
MQFRLNVNLLYGSGLAGYDGIIHDPHGGGGDKAFPTEAKSWSSLKALYR